MIVDARRLRHPQTTLALSDAPSHELSELHDAGRTGAARCAGPPTTETTPRSVIKARGASLRPRRSPTPCASTRASDVDIAEPLSRRRPRPPRHHRAAARHHPRRSVQIGELLVPHRGAVAGRVPSSRLDPPRPGRTTSTSWSSGLRATSCSSPPSARARPSLLRTLGPAAARCTGRVFLALIPHPDHWDGDTAGSVRTWQFRR